MLFQVYTENGVKKIKYLTADTGTGAPVGSYLMLEKKSNPQGYLYCDGSTFDETVYPALYQYLGTNVLPDWREFSAVGAEQNTTNVYDAQTNPNGVIHDHDVFTQGQAKDDQLQNHVHNTNANYDVASGSYFCTALGNTSAQSISSGGVASARVGTVTRGKRKAVFIYIKATSGLTENQQENVLNTINENLSYSTAEHKTGKKWIDGKDIWSATVDCGALPNATSKTVSHGIANIDRITKVECNSSTNAGLVIPIPYTPLDILGNGVGLSVDKTSIYIGTGVDRSNFTSTYCTLEYTKTTDN